MAQMYWGFSSPIHFLSAEKNYDEEIFLVTDDSQSANCCLPIFLFAISTILWKISSSDTVIVNPLTSRNIIIAADAARLLPSKKGWFSEI
jgi:hypothetical protein